MVGKCGVWRKIKSVVCEGDNSDCSVWQKQNIQKTGWSKMGAAKKRLDGRIRIPWAVGENEESMGEGVGVRILYFIWSARLKDFRVHCCLTVSSSKDVQLTQWSHLSMSPQLPDRLPWEAPLDIFIFGKTDCFSSTGFRGLFLMSNHWAVVPFFSLVKCVPGNQEGRTRGPQNQGLPSGALAIYLILWQTRSRKDSFSLSQHWVLSSLNTWFVLWRCSQSIPRAATGHELWGQKHQLVSIDT